MEEKSDSSDKRNSVDKFGERDGPLRVTEFTSPHSRPERPERRCAIILRDR